ADGTVDVKVLWTYGEGVVHVVVEAPVLASTTTIGSAGGIIQNPDGVQVGFGAGQLTADTSVTVTTIPQDQLPIPMVGGSTGAFPFAGAFQLDTSGSPVTGAIQMGVPTNGLANPGDTVYFFQQQDLPTGPNGTMQSWWAVVDSGTVDASGVARTGS